MSSDLNIKNSEVVIIEDIEDDNIINLNLYKIYFNDLLDGDKFIKKSKLINFIKFRGISINDVRFNNQIKLLDEEITIDKFIELINTNILLFKKIFENDLIIANWNKFINDIDNIYEETKTYNNGNVASYIPQLKNIDP